MYPLVVKFIMERNANMPINSKGMSDPLAFQHVGLGLYFRSLTMMGTLKGVSAFFCIWSFKTFTKILKCVQNRYLVF